MQVNSLISLAQNKMKLSQQQCFNYIKQCPYCGEIWMKVYGCEDQTFCGKLPEKEAEHFKQQKIPRRFKFQFQETGVTYNDLGIQFSKEDKTYQLQKQQQLELLRIKQQAMDRAPNQIIDIKRQYIESRLQNILPSQRPWLSDADEENQKGKIGCGEYFIWHELKPLSQEKLQELLDPGVLDYLANVVQLKLVSIKNYKKLCINEEKKAKQIELATQIEDQIKTCKVVILE